MRSCTDIEPDLTPYVDGDRTRLQPAEIDEHLAACPRCEGRVSTERMAREVVRARRSDLHTTAPEALRRRCEAHWKAAGGQPRIRPGVLRRSRLVPLSLAASLVLAAGVFLLFGWGSTVDTYAAQLAADHIKCTQLSSAMASGDVATLARQWRESNGWPLEIAPSSAAEDLELVGIRRCGSTHGRVAHVLYRWRGRPLSVYVLNEALGEMPGDSAPAIVKKFGEQELLWSRNGRTYAIVASAPLEDMQQVARYLRPRFE